MPDGEDYRILACSTGDLSRANFADALSRFQLGELNTLPQVSVSYVRPGTQQAVSYLALAIHWYAAEGQRYADGVGAAGQPGPAHRVHQLLLPAVHAPGGRGHQLPGHVQGAARRDADRGGRSAQRGADRTADIADPAIDDLAVRVAPLLLTGVPVCVLGADETSMLERLRFIDTVMGLLPYGFRVADDRGHLDEGHQPQPPVPAVLQQRAACGASRTTS